jgi:hypothetical protein
MDPHDELGISRGATADEVRRAFAAAIRRVHPDAGGGYPDAAEHIRRLVEARDQLLSRISRPAGADPAVTGGHRKLTRLQIAARVLGRLLYTPKHDDP